MYSLVLLKITAAVCDVSETTISICLLSLFVFSSKHSWKLSIDFIICSLLLLKYISKLGINSIAFFAVFSNDSSPSSIEFCCLSTESSIIINFSLLSLIIIELSETLFISCSTIDIESKIDFKLFSVFSIISL